jgi:hypothetical protein
VCSHAKSRTVIQQQPTLFSKDAGQLKTNTAD